MGKKKGSGKTPKQYASGGGGGGGANKPATRSNQSEMVITPNPLHASPFGGSKKQQKAHAQAALSEVESEESSSTPKKSFSYFDPITSLVRWISPSSSGSSQGQYQEAQAALSSIKPKRGELAPTSSSGEEGLTHGEKEKGKGEESYSSSSGSSGSSPFEERSSTLKPPSHYIQSPAQLGTGGSIRTLGTPKNTLYRGIATTPMAPSPHASIPPVDSPLTSPNKTGFTTSSPNYESNMPASEFANQLRSLGYGEADVRYAERQRLKQISKLSVQTSNRLHNTANPILTPSEASGAATVSGANRALFTSSPSSVSSSGASGLGGGLGDGGGLGEAAEKEQEGNEPSHHGGGEPPNSGSSGGESEAMGAAQGGGGGGGGAPAAPQAGAGAGGGGGGMSGGPPQPSGDVGEKTKPSRTGPPPPPGITPPPPVNEHTEGQGNYHPPPYGDGSNFAEKARESDSDRTDPITPATGSKQTPSTANSIVGAGPIMKSAESQSPEKVYGTAQERANMGRGAPSPWEYNGPYDFPSRPGGSLNTSLTHVGAWRSKTGEHETSVWRSHLTAKGEPAKRDTHYKWSSKEGGRWTQLSGTDAMKVFSKMDSVRNGARWLDRPNGDQLTKIMGSTLKRKMQDINMGKKGNERMNKRKRGADPAAPGVVQM